MTTKPLCLAAAVLALCASPAAAAKPDPWEMPNPKFPTSGACMMWLPFTLDYETGIAYVGAGYKTDCKFGNEPPAKRRRDWSLHA